MAILLPSFGAQAPDSAFQASPLLNSYSPRLFGSPPQLTSLCDMRTDSANGDNPGTVGNFYLQNILRDAQIANFVVGRAIFTGGYNSIANTIRMIGQYGYALKHYNIYNGATSSTGNVNASVLKEINLDTYNNELDLDSIDINEVINPTPLAEGEELTDEESVRRGRTASYGSTITQWLSDASEVVGASITASMLDSFKIQQPFYSFDADWFTYINNVKMMINAAVVMLGLQDACVRIGDNYYPIGMNHKEKDDNSDVWSNYRFITSADGVSQITSIDNQKGENGQYVSFMVTPVNEAESYTNTIGESQIYSSVIKQGESIGNEIAFITNSSASAVSDAVVSIAGGTISAAEKVISALGSGVGRFTASIAGGMARSFTGDHVIYPKIFQSHESHGGMTLNIKLRASRGDPYSYLMEILVPLFHILGMVLPKMSKHSAGAYNYPPLVQCTIPGIWGTRLGMIESVEITKNPDSNDFSINGYPLAVDVSMRVVDLTHCMVTSPMNNAALFINNHTMFDYIAQCCGVDKYRINGSARLVTKLALTAYNNTHMFHNIGNAILNDATTTINRLTRTSMM